MPADRAQARSGQRLRLGVLASHPIQYQAPVFRALAARCELDVFFAHRQSAQAQAQAGFGVAFDWDVDLLSGYRHRFLTNVAHRPGVDHFRGCNTPEIADLIRDGHYDAFLVQGWHLQCFWQAVRACLRLGVPVMVRGDSQLGTPRGRLKQWIKTWVYPTLLRQFDGCLYVGQRNREYLEHYGVPASRLFFSPHCVDNDAFAAGAARVDRAASRAALGLSESTKAVLFVGKLLGRKRPLDLLYASATLRGQGVDVHVVFAGDGPLRDDLANAARELAVPTHFLGFRNQTELPEAYTLADVMALPSEASETWGLVANEALACGTPIVISDAAGCAPDLVDDGETGAVHAMGRIEQLADALARALAIPRNAPAIAAKVDAYSVRATADGILAATTSLTSTRRG